MKVMIVSCVFPPEPLVTAVTSGDLARTLSEEGHQVTVIAPFPNRPAGRLYPGYRRTLIRREVSPAGYPVYHCFNILSASSTLLSRWSENISFGITSALAALFLPRPDVIYSNSWPIFATASIRLVARLKRIPVVLSIQDVFPEVLVSQGNIKQDGALFRLLLNIDRWIAGGCRAVIVLSEQFAQTYRDLRHISAERLAVIPNWIPANSVVVGSKEPYRKERDIPAEAFVLVYGGNINKTAGVGTVIQALDQVQAGRPVYLVVAGAGSQLKACQALASSLPGVRVLFHSPWDEADKSRVLAAADVFILPTLGELASVPSKLISYLLASRPVLAVVRQDSEIASIINKTGCGWVVAPDQPDRLTAKIAGLANTPEQTIDEKGKAGREYALKNLVSEACLPKVINILMGAAEK